MQNTEHQREPTDVRMLGGTCQLSRGTTREASGLMMEWEIPGRDGLANRSALGHTNDDPLRNVEVQDNTIINIMAVHSAVVDSGTVAVLHLPPEGDNQHASLGHSGLQLARFRLV